MGEHCLKGKASVLTVTQSRIKSTHIYPFLSKFQVQDDAYKDYDDAANDEAPWLGLSAASNFPDHNVRPDLLSLNLCQPTGSIGGWEGVVNNKLMLLPS